MTLSRKLKRAINKEVLAAQAAAYAPEKTHVNTGTILEYIRNHPGDCPELARRSDQSAKDMITRALKRLKFPQYTNNRNGAGNRIFCRPAALLRISTSQSMEQLSAAAGGAP